jgi:signal transduction histidine kinase
MNQKGRITIHMNEVRSTKNQYVEVDITDTGDGIPDNILANIFNPFYTTKDVGEGTGLGLTMVYNLVDNWGGKITIQNQEAGGTKFIFTIPISDKV